MSLPLVAGWLIDFRTARAIFQSGKNDRIAHCVGLCEQMKLRLSHCEEDFFRGMPLLSGPFIEIQNCVQEPDEDICNFCATIDANPNGKMRTVGNDAALYLTAAALSKNLGVISDHRSPKFATVYDLCKTYGVAILSSDEYFSLAI